MRRQRLAREKLRAHPERRVAINDDGDGDAEDKRELEDGFDYAPNLFRSRALRLPTLYRWKV
jgi:hypothetical protein